VQARQPDLFVIQQRAFVLRSTGDWIDEERTRAIFGHPHVQRFVPLGPSIGIFEYRGRFYFDSFLDPELGDFEGICARVIAALKFPLRETLRY
jgi:hypothetical protein